MLRSTTPATSGELFRPSGDALSPIQVSRCNSLPKVAKGGAGGVWRGSLFGRTRRSQHGEIGEPWSHGAGVLPAHHPGDLSQVVEIVGHPGREELTQGDGTELGMAAATLEIRWRQPQRFEAGEVLGS